MKTLRKITSSLFCGVLCVTGTLWAFAAPWMPEEPSKDEAALVGFYQGNGESLAVRENAGQLEILYRYQPKDKDFTKSNVFTLVKNYYDNYELREIGPNTDATSTLRFDRDKNGQGISLNMGQKSYTRRFGGENGRPMRITPPKPMEELRKEAEAAQPPSPAYQKTAQLVEITSVVPGIVYDLRYTTANNIFGAPLVQSNHAYLDRSAAQALNRVQQDLKPYGYGLVFWEGYRSWSDFKLATLALGEKHQDMLPKAEEGYAHNTGRSVDVSLVDLASGEEVSMISDFDEPSPAQYAQFAGGTQKQRYLRDLLRQMMTREGFTGSDMEWWHFDWDAGTTYQILNTKEP